MTAPLSSELRARLGNVIQEARRAAESGARQALKALAVDRPKPFGSMSLTETAQRNALRNRGRQAGDRIDGATGAQPIARLAHDVAYEHWHRMLFARFLAENELLIAPEYGVAVSLDDLRDLAREEGRDPWQLAGEWAQGMLPEIFATDDPALELKLAPETGQTLEELIESLPATAFTASDSLGWTYQYWRAEEKDRVNASGAKIGADELPAVTQLFTERYMVLFLLHNTVGAWRAGKMLAEDTALATSASDEAALRKWIRLATGGGYDFTYSRFTRAAADGDEDDERSGPWRPVAGTFADWPRAARDLRVLDPCCGSGHFLVEAFELLVRLRIEEEGLSARDAARAVLSDNLFALEIDPRCTQIAAFNLALAAWRVAGGWMRLPPLNIACCGTAPNTSEAEWVRLADDLEGLTGLAEDPDLFGSGVSLAQGPLQQGMARLHGLFRRAGELGSLIDPETAGGDLFRAGYRDLKTLLDRAIERERRTGQRNEQAVAAAGMARAAEILMGRYTLVVTNVPFLGRENQDKRLRDFSETHHGDAKRDIATVFLSRIFRWLGDHGTQALVTPQNWLFLTSYRHLRERLLKERTWNVVARLGPSAFETISGEVVSVALVVLSAGKPHRDSEMAGLDVSSPRGEPPIRAAEKARLLADGAEVIESVQAEQLKNPDAAVLMRPVGERTLLGRYCNGFVGMIANDRPAYVRRCWEVLDVGVSEPWVFQQGTVKQTVDFGGLEYALHWGESPSPLLTARDYGYRGRTVWNHQGVAVSQIGALPVTRYTGEKFDNNAAVAGPLSGDQLAAVWAFCSSPDYHAAVREINQKLSVTNAALVKVPFDLDHWTKVAAERYPNGLPEPYSDEPTQWIFHGDPCRSVIWDEQAKVTAHGLTRFDHTVLQVAVARLLGYRWPAELDPDMRLAPEQRAVVEGCANYDDLADEDGIVCLSPARGEVSAADRLRALLMHAYGDEWSAATNPDGRTPRSLEVWLRDNFFIEHCKLFQHRPFVWHIWDGRKDGFHALVNYHRLAGPGGEGRRTLESLTYAYLNDWIGLQRAERSDGVAGADDRLAHAMDLRQQLERILTGDPPCDLFVRWKPLRAQAIGWEPDLDDGVRLNIRPFMRAELRKGGRAGAGILVRKPNVKWGKDRGKEPEEPRPREDFPWFWGCPGKGVVEVRTDFEAAADAEFDGNRWNDLHYSRGVKEAARARRGGT
ncbi:MAG: N-6 DNA methylase [Gammaproteobacteria bacterium]|nr:N-6 DNA methylase [Gammaproteobacteria bacterium]